MATHVLLNWNGGNPKWWAGDTGSGEVAWGSVGRCQSRIKDAQYVLDTRAKKLRQGGYVDVGRMEARLAMPRIGGFLQSVRSFDHDKMIADARSLFQRLDGKEPAPPDEPATPTAPKMRKTLVVSKESVKALDDAGWF